MRIQTSNRDHVNSTRAGIFISKIGGPLFCSCLYAPGNLESRETTNCAKTLGGPQGNAHSPGNHQPRRLGVSLDAHRKH